MQTEVEIRRASVFDSDQVANVLIGSRKELLPFAPSIHTDDETRLWVRNRLLPLETVLVALVTQQIVGVAATTRESGISWITQMYVSPGYIRKGIGGLLLERSMKGLTHPVRLHVFEKNLVARRFYEQKGFVAIGSSDGSDNEERCPSVLYELTSNTNFMHNQSKDPAA